MNVTNNPEQHMDSNDSEAIIRPLLAEKFEVAEHDVSADDTISWLTDRIRELPGEGLKVVSVLGGAASGKTTVITALLDELNAAGVRADCVNTDDFVRGDRQWRWEHVEAQPNVDPIEKYDFGFMNKKIQAIRNNTDPAVTVAIPTYNSETGKAIAEGEENYTHKVGLVDVLVVGGDFHEVQDSDLVIFLHVPDAQRLQNRVNRDVIERGGSHEKTTANFNLRQKSQHLPHTVPAAEHADYVVDTDASNAEEWRFTIYKRK